MKIEKACSCSLSIKMVLPHLEIRPTELEFYQWDCHGHKLNYFEIKFDHNERYKIQKKKVLKNTNENWT